MGRGVALLDEGFQSTASYFYLWERRVFRDKLGLASGVIDQLQVPGLERPFFGGSQGSLFRPRKALF